MQAERLPDWKKKKELTEEEKNVLTKYAIQYKGNYMMLYLHMYNGHGHA